MIGSFTYPSGLGLSNFTVTPQQVYEVMHGVLDPIEVFGATFDVDEHYEGLDDIYNEGMGRALAEAIKANLEDPLDPTQTREAFASLRTGEEVEALAEIDKGVEEARAAEAAGPEPDRETDEPDADADADTPDAQPDNKPDNEC